MTNKNFSIISVALFVTGAIFGIALTSIYVAVTFYCAAFIIYFFKDAHLPKIQENQNPLPAPFSKFSLDLTLSAVLFLIVGISAFILLISKDYIIWDSNIVFFFRTILPLISIISIPVLIFTKKEKWLLFPFGILFLTYAIDDFVQIAGDKISRRHASMIYADIFVISGYLILLWESFNIFRNKASLPKFWKIYSIIAILYSAFAIIRINPIEFILPSFDYSKQFADLIYQSNNEQKIKDLQSQNDFLRDAFAATLSLAFVMYLKWVSQRKEVTENTGKIISHAETDPKEISNKEKESEFNAAREIYLDAVKRMQTAKTVSEWKELSNIFASIRGFKDSEALSKECLECANALLEANSLRPAPKPKTSPKTQKIILISIIAFVVVCSAAGFFVYQKKQAEERQAFLEEIRQREIEREEEIRKENERLKEEQQKEEEERRKEEERQAEIRKRNAVPQNLESIAKYLNLYGESKTNYAEKCTEQIKNLASALSGRMTYEELLKIINKEPSDLDGKHYTKVSDIASPQSVAKQKQAHKDYVPILVNDKTVRKGLEFFDEYRDTILRAYRETGVKPEDILAVLNWESKFGEYKGTFSVYQIFMGQICYLPEIEQNHFESGAYASNKVMKRPNALKRLEKLKKKSVENMAALISMAMDKHFNFYEIQGSWAGAIGIPQFMPSSMNFAADGDGDGEIDLNNMHDAIFSVATYLEQHGYKEQGAKHAFMAYNPEEMYVRGVSLYSQKIVTAGLRY